MWKAGPEWHLHHFDNIQTAGHTTTKVELVWLMQAVKQNAPLTAPTKRR